MNARITIVSRILPAMILALALSSAAGAQDGSIVGWGSQVVGVDSSAA